MTTVSSRFETIARLWPNSAVAPAELLADRLGELYAASQKSSYVFGSPLGPFHFGGVAHHLPRFVHFGPQTHDASLRLAFLAGHDRNDLNGSFALAEIVQELSRDPFLGQGLNLTFFPVIDVLGLNNRARDRNLAGAPWAHSRFPELDLLAKDARLRGYHGFIQLDRASGSDEISVRLLQPAGSETAGPAGGLIPAADFAPHPVRWETAVAGSPTETAGPLALLDDLPLRPFELRLSVPASWSDAVQREALGSILKRFLLRQRAAQAFAQNL
jgi:hypothetical protein